MPKPITVRVTTMEAELEFAIQPGTNGKQLFDQVVKTIGLREIWYFGLQYVDTKGYNTWLKLNKKVIAQDVPRVSKDSKDTKDGVMQFKFRVKFFPEDVTEELIQDITQRLFFLQVKESILTEEVYCPPETAVLLSSYAAQAKFGDYNRETQPTGFLSTERILPERVLQQHSLTKLQWEEKIVNWYSEHKSMLKEDAMLEYLKIAQDLEMYGVNYFDIKNKKNTDLFLGVDTMGLNVYSVDDKLTPKIGFPWCEIRNISFNDKKFMIKPVEKNQPDFCFFAPRLRINKRILALCMGNHELYLRRRKPDTIEVQQMKTQAREEKHIKQMQRASYQRVKKELEDAERKKKEYEDDLKKQKMMNDQLEQERARQAASVTLLENRVRRAEEESQLQEKSRLKTEEEMKKIALDSKIQKQESEALSRQARDREKEAQRVAEEAEKKAKELEQQKRELDKLTLEEKEKQREMDRLIAVPQIHVSEGNTDDTEEDQTAEATELSSMEGATGVSSEENRITNAERNKAMASKLRALTDELAESRQQTADTRLDILHMENVKQGRDKYKTLKQIRQGNTKHRVELFENL